MKPATATALASRLTTDVLVRCRRCACEYATPGELIAHKEFLHRMGPDAARKEAAEDATACPGCGRRSGAHNKRCRYPMWRPVVAPPKPWVYEVPTPLPLRVALRAFRKSYLAHVLRVTGPDQRRLAEVLGLAGPAQVRHAYDWSGLTANKGNQKCSRCGDRFHNARRCPKPRRRL